MDKLKGSMGTLRLAFQARRNDFMVTITEYIDFSENGELWKEAERMDGLGESICKEVRDKDIQALSGTILRASLQWSVSLRSFKNFWADRRSIKTVLPKMCL